jgi:hypothetical protein
MTEITELFVLALLDCNFGNLSEHPAKVLQGGGPE